MAIFKAKHRIKENAYRKFEVVFDGKISDSDAEGFMARSGKAKIEDSGTGFKYLGAFGQGDPVVGVVNTMIVSVSGTVIYKVKELLFPLTKAVDFTSVHDAPGAIFAGADEMRGSRGNDLPRGFAGDDLINGRAGRNKLQGDEGSDNAFHEGNVALTPDQHIIYNPIIGVLSYDDGVGGDADQHRDHQFRVDRGTAIRAIEGPNMLSDSRQVDEAVNRAKQMVGRNVALQAELVEQRLLHHRPLAHHRRILPCSGGLNQDFTPPPTPSFSTQSVTSSDTRSARQNGRSSYHSCRPNRAASPALMTDVS